MQHTAIPGEDGVTHACVSCFRCNRMGHYANKCPSSHPTCNNQDPKGVETQLLQCGLSSHHGVHKDFTFTQRFMQAIPLSWILLDSESTISGHVTVHTNGGMQVSKMIGDISNFRTVWFNPRSIANILSLAAVRKICRITMDTTVELAYLVYRKDGSIMKFKEFYSSLYYQITSLPDVTDRCRVESSNFLNLVAENKKIFTMRQIVQVDKGMLGCPSEQVIEQQYDPKLPTDP
jgi:hypothetical protein